MTGPNEVPIPEAEDPQDTKQMSLTKEKNHDSQNKIQTKGYSFSLPHQSTNHTSHHCSYCLHPNPSDQLHSSDIHTHDNVQPGHGKI